jgi:hypothetical protein
VLQLDDDDRFVAKVIAMVVRNALEEIHGGGNLLDRRIEGGVDGGLTDEQMRHINRIVRDGVATARYALMHPEMEACQQYIDFQASLIPDYLR